MSETGGVAGVPSTPYVAEDMEVVHPYNIERGNWKLPSSEGLPTLSPTERVELHTIDMMRTSSSLSLGMCNTSQVCKASMGTWA